jgi:hypothetical protein
MTAAGGTSARGYGRPLRRKLKLRVTNPDARVTDAKMPRTETATNEFPPSVVTAGGRRWLFIGSGHSVAVEIRKDIHILKDPGCSVHSPAIYSIGGIAHEVRLGRLPPLYDIPTDQYWRHTYCGAFDVRVLPEDSRHPDWVFSINHCENKNLSWRTKYTKFFTTNSVNPADEATPETTSGNLGGGFHDYQPAYFGFVSMSYAPITAETKWGAELFHYDQGPILWPSTGIMTPDGKQKLSRYHNPHPHPSCLIAEDPRDGRKYIYVFALDSAIREEFYRMVIAARSPIESRALPGSFSYLYRGNYSEPAMPADMSGGIQKLRTRRGGNCDPIHPTADGSHGNICRFAVTRLQHSGLFLGIETYVFGQGGRSYIESALRLSEDLRTWTDRSVIPNTRIESHQINDRKHPPYCLYYPKFLSADGSSHNDVDETETFYVIGTKPLELVYRELSIEID